MHLIASPDGPLRTLAFELKVNVERVNVCHSAILVDAAQLSGLKARERVHLLDFGRLIVNHDVIFLQIDLEVPRLVLKDGTIVVPLDAAGEEAGLRIPTCVAESLIHSLGQFLCTQSCIPQKRVVNAEGLHRFVVLVHRPVLEHEFCVRGLVRPADEWGGEVDGHAADATVLPLQIKLLEHVAPLV
jgi:hypothetical protein